MSALQKNQKEQIKKRFTVCEDCGAEYEYSWSRGKTILSIYLPCPDCLNGQTMDVIEDYKDEQ